MANYLSLSYYLPVVLVVGSNVIYHVGAKSVPKDLNPMISTIVAYLVGAAFAFIIYLITDPTKDLVGQFKLVNWAPIVIGLSIVGLEVGFVLLYRAGWNISIGSLVCNILLAIALIIVGILLYKEAVSSQQFIGIALCIAGLVFINK